jgi:hypothetical protein
MEYRNPLSVVIAKPQPKYKRGLALWSSFFAHAADVHDFWGTDRPPLNWRAQSRIVSLSHCLEQTMPLLVVSIEQQPGR